MIAYKFHRQLIFCILAFLYLNSGNAQTDMPFRGADTDLLKDTLKTDKSGTYYLWREQDSVWMVFLSSGPPYSYRLLDMKEQVLVTGELGEQPEGGHLLVRHGRWSEYYKEGGIKSTGYYEAGQPAGYWEYYYPNGAKRKTYQYTKVELDGQAYLLILGAYEEFYSNGQVKIIGKYMYQVDTVEAEGLVSNNSEPVYNYVPVAQKAGTWYYYRANGEIFKEEKY